METVEVRDPERELGAEDAEVERGLAEIRALVEANRVEEARPRILVLAEQWPDSEATQRWARVLAPPRTRSRPDIKARPRDKERAWLREHSREYPGQWVAVFEDRLLAADADAQVVFQQIRELPEGGHALLAFQPRPQE